MLEHHQLAIEAFVAKVSSEDSFQAIILTGSLAQGRGREDSDIDAYLVVSEEEYEARKARYELSHIAPCDYPGGYIDGKIVSKSFLEAAAVRGSEPTRASFGDARVVYSKLGDLQPLVDSIPRYPEGTRAQNIVDFFCEFYLHAGYFGPAAVKRDDPFLLSHAVTNMTLYAGRLMLAYNRELFPCPKQMLEALRRCRDLPDGFVAATIGLLAEPDMAAISEYMNLVVSFTDWGVARDEILTRFMDLDEWSWLEDHHSVAQR